MRKETSKEYCGAQKRRQFLFEEPSATLRVNKKTGGREIDQRSGKKTVKIKDLMMVIKAKKLPPNHEQNSKSEIKVIEE